MADQHYHKELDRWVDDGGPVPDKDDKDDDDDEPKPIVRRDTKHPLPKPHFITVTERKNEQ